MKILHLNTYDLNGGAARAVYRLHQALQQAGAQSQILVQRRTSDDKTIVASKDFVSSDFAAVRSLVNRTPTWFYKQRDRVIFSPQWFPDKLAPQVEHLNPDVVHLHWLGHGYLQIETLAKLNRPLVWTLHDMWVFTGGCHYSQGCTRYKASCGACPQLGSDRQSDLSHQIWKRKTKAWKDLNLTIVSPSQWLAECARSSSLLKRFRIEVIPHGLDTTRYRPVEQQYARHLLRLPQDKKLILFGAMGATSDKRKGLSLLEAALQKLIEHHPHWKEMVELAIFGASESKYTHDLGFKTHYLGHLHDDLSLSVVYSAADVMITPSIEEAFGQTASEALSCGTPVVSFDSTGLQDIVDHQQTGYRARCFEPEDMANGIAWVLEQPERLQELSQNARSKAERIFSLEAQAKAHLDIYHSLAGSHG